MLTSRFQEALVYAAEIHATQRRKGTDIPYVSHLLAVASLVLEHGGDEDQAIAALLHDAVEDQGGQPRLDDIRDRFGEHVATMVEACTDGLDGQKAPWRERKEAYLTHLKGTPIEARLISCADKLHNARSILHDFRQYGDSLWSRFKGGKDGSLWYYEALVIEFLERGPERLAQQLAETVSQLREEAGN